MLLGRDLSVRRHRCSPIGIWPKTIPSKRIFWQSVSVFGYRASPKRERDENNADQFEHVGLSPRPNLTVTVKSALIMVNASRRNKSVGLAEKEARASPRTEPHLAGFARRLCLVALIRTELFQILNSNIYYT
jgi:hypothetical protein